MKTEKYLKVIFGLLMVIIGLYSYTLTAFGGYPWWQDLIRLIKGGLGIIIVLAGLLLLLIGSTE